MIIFFSYWWLSYNKLFYLSQTYQTIHVDDERSTGAQISLIVSKYAALPVCHFCGVPSRSEKCHFGGKNDYLW